LTVYFYVPTVTRDKYSHWNSVRHSDLWSALDT